MQLNIQKASTESHEGKGEVSHLWERVEWLPDVAYRRAPALRLLRRRKEWRLLGVIGLSSWWYDERAGGVWRRLVLRCGLWLLPASGDEEE